MTSAPATGPPPIPPAIALHLLAFTLPWALARTIRAVRPLLLSWGGGIESPCPSDKERLAQQRQVGLFDIRNLASETTMAVTLAYES